MHSCTHLLFFYFILFYFILFYFILFFCTHLKRKTSETPSRLDSKTTLPALSIASHTSPKPSTEACAISRSVPAPVSRVVK